MSNTFNYKLPLILAIVMALMVLLAFAWAHNMDTQDSVTQGELADVPESLRPTTYKLPENIFLPEMEFLVVDAGDSLAVRQCKNMAFVTVDRFSRKVNSNLVRADKKLYTLAREAYGACLDLQTAMIREG